MYVLLANEMITGMEKYSPPPPRVMAPSSSTGTPPFYRQFIPQYAFPYSAYGWVDQIQKPLHLNNIWNFEVISLIYKCLPFLTFRYPGYTQDIYSMVSTTLLF